MYNMLLIVFLLVAIGMIALIMLQRGKGAEMGASFGAGASATLFGSSGSSNFYSRVTAVLATLFFIISLVLGNITTKQGSDGNRSDFEDLTIAGEQTVASGTTKPAGLGDDLPK